MVCSHCRGVLWPKRNTGIRYYLCQCGNPSNARRLAKPVYALRDVHAASIEDELWRDLTVTLLDPESLRAGLAAAHAQYTDADRVRRDRLDALEAEVCQQQSRLDRLS